MIRSQTPQMPQIMNDHLPSLSPLKKTYTPTREQADGIDLPARRIQRVWRGWHLRKKFFHFDDKLHLGYEVHVMHRRIFRQRMLRGFALQMSYLFLLATVIALQQGSAVTDRFELENTVDEFVTGLETPSGRTIDNVGNFDEVWDWSMNGLFANLKADTGNRVWLRTYNQLVGTVRIETVRISDDSCPWQHTRAANDYRVENVPAKCYGKSLPQYILHEPYGPQYDMQRYNSRKVLGESRYVVDLGVDPKFGQKRMNELFEGNFISRATRSIDINLVVYNHALPMFCFLKISLKMLPTGLVKSQVISSSVPVQPYLHDFAWLQITLEVLLVAITVYHASLEIQKLLKRGSANKQIASQYEELNVYNVLAYLRVVMVFATEIVWY